MSTLKSIPQGAVLLDTCAWIDAFVQPEKLNPAIRAYLDTHPELKLSAISPWEVAILVNRKRLELKVPIETWLQLSIDDANIVLVPLTPPIALESATLPGDFHKDPADRIIVATARKYNLPILTSDQKIHDYAHVDAIQSR